MKVLVIGISPIKTHSLAKTIRISGALTKHEKGFEKQKEIVANIFDVDKSDLSINAETIQKADDLDRLLDLMKKPLSDTTLKTSLIIQILTIAPQSWSRSKVANFFNVSEYLVCKSRKLAETKGILESPDSKKGKTISEEVRQSVLLFYEDDEYSRLMPGTKDYVSISRNVHKQKRLPLCNLNELYAAYKDKYPHNKIGLSKFCSQRPKWCITVSASGSHSVCMHNPPKHKTDCQCVFNRYKQLYKNIE